MNKFKDAAATVARPFAVLGAMLSVLLLGGLALAGSASATPADPVADGYADLTSKVTLYGGLFVALVVLTVGILFGVKWIRKARSA